MRFSTSFLALLATILPSALASSCGEYYDVKVVTFDKLAVGQKVPDQYPAGPAGVNWTNFQVVDPAAHGLKPRSGKNGVWFNGASEGAIEIGNPDNLLVDPIILHAVSFGCFLDYPDPSTPYPCDLAVVANPDVFYHGARIRGFGPLSFKPTNNVTKGETASKLQRFDFGSIDTAPSGGIISFILFNQALPGDIIFDNFEFCVLKQS